MNETSLQRRPALGANWVNAFLAVWIMISPFVLGFSNQTAIMWNSVATGAAIFLLSVGHSGRSFGPTALVVLLGIWLIISPFVLRASGPVVIRENVILGILVAIIALSNRTRSLRRTEAPHPPNP